MKSMTTVEKNADDQREVAPWTPMTRPIHLKHLGKLGEEAGELGSAVCRCIIQGIDEREPVTGKLNREWLEDEIADVTANIALVTEHFTLNRAKIDVRVQRKMLMLCAWHAMLVRPEYRFKIGIETFNVDELEDVEKYMDRLETSNHELTDQLAAAQRRIAELEAA